MRLSLLSWLFHTLPETLAAASLALALCTETLEWKRIFTIGIPFAVAVFLVRLLPLAFGVHFIILMIIFGLLIALEVKLPFSRCLLTALVVGMILAVSETFFIFIFSRLTRISMDEVVQMPHLHISFAWGHIIFLFLLALVVNKWKTGRALKGKEFHG